MKQKKQLLLTLALAMIVGISFGQRVIRGTVSDSSGTGLANVSIVVPGTSKGTASDGSGKYSISVPDDARQLTFSQVGYAKRTVDIAAGISNIDVTLTAVAGTLSDVVVVGYGVQRKRDLTGSVSNIKGDDFKNLPISNPAQALQGRAAGVNIVRNDAAPGSVPTIRVRGTGTINNADPLIVIDGVPQTSPSSMTDLNPNDIASIDVLKDASAAAIYGTRAANGVVLVTTKKGNLGEALKASLNAYTGTSKAIKYLDLLTAPQLVELKKEAFTNDGSQVPPIWNDPYYATQRTDWQRALIGKGKTQNADFALRGGSEKSTYSFSGNYYNESGMIPNTYFDRLSARINSEHKLLKIFTVGENLLYSASKGAGIDTRSTQTGTVWSALRFNPAIPVHNADGSWGTSKADNELGDINNPVFTAVSPQLNNRKNTLITNGYIQAQIFKGLTVKANFGYTEEKYNNYGFQPAEPNQTRTITLSSLNQSLYENYSQLEEYTLTYNNLFAGVHSVNFTGGYSAQTFKGDYFAAWRNGFDDTTAPQRNLNNGNQALQFNSGSKYVVHGLASYFGRLNYAYKGKYLLTATVRSDGSSKFPADRRWGTFPAFSVGWRVSDESWFSSTLPFFSNLKLTAGWGQMGNQEVPDLQYLAVIGTGQTYNFGNTPVLGTAVANLANPYITWERAEMTNVSVEFGLLRNKLNGTLTYFNKNTKDMLIPYSIVETYGIAVIPNQNIGTLNNHGVEVELNYQNKAGAFTYSIGANASFIKNKVTLLYGDEKNYIGSTLYGRQALDISRTYQGQPLASFYGYKTNGLYQTQKDIDNDPGIANDPNKGSIKPGDVRFVDKNGDGVIDDNDRGYLGNPNPKVVYGINGSAAFKGFDLSFSFSGVSGVQLYNADKVAGLDATSVFNWYAEEESRWHGEGTSNTVPRLTRQNSNNNYRSSDLWIENGSYLALKNISLGYTFSRLHIADVNLPQLRVYASCYNAFYITKYSGFTPELGLTDAGNNRQLGVDLAQYPSARTITFGASINF